MFDEIITPLLSTSWGRRAGWALTLCMSILFAYTLISTLLTWRSDFIIVHSQHNNISAYDDDTASKLIAQIPNQHLFGKYATLDQNAILPITSLQLRLLGVIKAEPEKFSRVIISETGQPGKVFLMNDRLSCGVRVHEVIQDGVILDNGGRLEKLPLQRSSLSFQGMPKSMLAQQKTQEE